SALRISSSPGKGAKISIELPYAPVANEPHRDTATPDIVAGPYLVRTAH
ncbi:MAG: hypothetical protein GY765_25895, partial [bacterium]|nr:hypothetical protein [bacterium]